MRTPPWPLSVSPMPRQAAVTLAATLRESDPLLPGIVGPRRVAQGIADALGLDGHITTTDLVRVLREYRPPTQSSGTSRPADPADLNLVLRWWSAFARDAGLPIHDTESLPARLAEMIADQRLLLWDDASEVTAMGGHASLVSTAGVTVGRIGPVFTPAQHRRRGYGAAITAAVVEHLQSRCDVIMLFTDSENPTSNGVYERLGFDVVDEIVEFECHDANRSDD
jgi:predicted GNAT family acetyltransferase